MLERCFTSYLARHGACAAWMNADTLCDKPLHHTGLHRGHDPSGSGAWIECDDDGQVVRWSC